jgi:thiosulfate reductase cytochrome b subunit
MTTDTMTAASIEATIHPRWVRVCHWTNALAILVMIGSGWQIYNASPLFDFLVFPRQIALGNWLAGALLWHFAAMWVLVINGVVYVTLGIVTGPRRPLTLQRLAETTLYGRHSCRSRDRFIRALDLEARPIPGIDGGVRRL